ncbi:MAG: hypothetical protein AAFX99_16665, partial [Myxococcota bacterium]
MHLDGKIGPWESDTLFAVHQRVCEASHAGRCLELAWLYRDGRQGVLPNSEHSHVLALAAQRHLETQCGLGWGNACLALGLLLHRGEWGHADPVQGQALLAQSCHTFRQARGCYNLALSYAQHDDSQPVPRHLLALACHLGYARACSEPALVPEQPTPSTAPKAIICDLDQKGTPPSCSEHNAVPSTESSISWQEALPLSERVLWNACREGQAKACVTLSDVQRFGIGVPIDRKAAQQLSDKAKVLYARGCAKGQAKDCRALAEHHARSGEDSDAIQAGAAHAAERALHKEACTHGDRDGCVQWARMLTQGQPVRRDEVQAKALLTEACARDHAQACAQLAKLFNRKRRPGFDRGKALHFYGRACELGAMASCRTAIRLWRKQGEPDKARNIHQFMQRRTEALCEEGNVGACTTLYDLLMKASEPDEAAAQVVLEKAFRQL